MDNAFMVPSNDAKGVDRFGRCQRKILFRQARSVIALGSTRLTVGAQAIARHRAHLRTLPTRATAHR